MTQMKKTLSIIVLAMASICAAAAEPSDASVEKLLSLSKAESTIDAMFGNFEAAMRQGMAQAVAGQPLTDEQRRVLEIAPKKFVQVVREEFNWFTFKPVLIKIYKESFDQDDIDGLNAFYGSKAGQAYVNKMPVAMQKSVAAAQERVVPLAAKMTAAMKAALEEAKLGK